MVSSCPGETLYFLTQSISSRWTLRLLPDFLLCKRKGIPSLLPSAGFQNHVDWRPCIPISSIFLCPAVQNKLGHSSLRGFTEHNGEGCWMLGPGCGAQISVPLAAGAPGSVMSARSKFQPSTEGSRNTSRTGDELIIHVLFLKQCMGARQ